MEETSNKHLVLEELQRTYDKKFEAGDILDGKLQNMLNFLSVVVPVVPAIIGSTLFDKIGLAFWILTFLVLVLYLKCFQEIMGGLSPSEYIQPISSDWDTLDRRLFQNTPDEAMNIIISSYIAALEEANTQNIRKEKIFRDVSVLMRWIVILLFLSVPAGLFIPSP